VLPVWAYYYLWFNASSWSRAKRDIPLAGRYSSDEPSVMRSHIRAARQAGITGFLVSWKDTPVNDERLDKLVHVASEEHFALGLVYQGLDVQREPIPVERVRKDLVTFQERWGGEPVFAQPQGPLVVWAGTWRFTAAEVRRVSEAVRPALQLLASERQTDRWADIGPLVDGNAYYWSSLDPDKDKHAGERLAEMSRAVHATHDTWLPSVAPGFDARLIGGTRLVERKDGDTLRREWSLAVQSSPDALGVISWNEFTENTFVEPSRLQGDRSLRVLASLTRAEGPQGELDSSAPAGGGGASPPWRAALVGVVLLSTAVAAGWRARRRDERHVHGEPRLPSGLGAA
jgi:hypothetical protein